MEINIRVRGVFKSFLTTHKSSYHTSFFISHPKLSLLSVQKHL